MNYKDSGVDIEAGRDFVERLMKKAPAIGGFSGMVRVPSGYEKPILVSGADGVGTKINIAKVSRDFTTIGIDLVAMCVNDVITCGAKPLYFLDYISTGKISPIIDQIMEGIIKGCDITEIDLLGGETAEHPRPAPPPAHDDDIDLAGFCTGIVEESQIIDGRLIKPGDKVIGIESSGLHSNGYTLVNDMLWRHKIFYKEGYEESFGEDIRDISPTPELLTPTTIYAPVVERLLKEGDWVYGMSHITGGGIPENLPRCLPKGLKAHVDWNAWSVPEIFLEIQKQGNMDELEMRRVFNLGIGYCVIVPANRVELTMDIIRDENINCWEIGEVYAT